MRAFPRYPACPVCGDPAVNPAALAVRWFWDPERRLVLGGFTPEPQHSGYEGRMHGGLLSSLLDECMAWACAMVLGTFCVTGELTMRFKDVARTGERLELSGQALDGWGRYLRSSGEARGAGGRLVARASATFAAMPVDEARRMSGYLVREPDAVDIFSEASGAADAASPR